MMNAEQHTLTVPTSSTAPPEVSVFVSFSGHDIIALYFFTPQNFSPVEGNKGILCIAIRHLRRLLSM